ncbi:hypothetical protein [Bradyrhizobium sp. USDA 329]|uniref:hypothetical protein n=1 Tax=unclassified Bradyrhizobium TaxID=2631580 RepID=UPI003518A2D4
MSAIFRSLSSPPLLLILVWCAILIGVVVGPIEYPLQPSKPVLAILLVGIVLFNVAYGLGLRSAGPLFGSAFNKSTKVKAMEIAVSVTAVVGVTGIALIAVDRTILSGVSNSGYSELLRCAPALVEVLEIKRGPLLYLGYLMFSFGFVSLTLFHLRGEEIKGWPAILGQVSIVSPIGYAVLYSGRMPILFLISLGCAAGLVRLGSGRPLFPRGHRLLLKTVIAVLLFALYSNAIWARRQNFCVQMGGLIRELTAKIDPGTLSQIRRSAESISAADLSAQIQNRLASLESNSSKPTEILSSSILMIMEESWHVRPRQYVISAIQAGYISERAALGILSSWFYLTHGVRILDLVWQARSDLSPLYGVYEIGVLSPILRVFLPQNQLLASMKTQLNAAEVYGFFPSVWAAAYIDFGALGAVFYILLWGFAAGWSAYGARRTDRITPCLVLSFTLATILLSPIQGPLGIANSTLVLLSIIITGIAVDLSSSSSIFRLSVAGRAGNVTGA